jgi:hypothetical protein
LLAIAVITSSFVKKVRPVAIPTGWRLPLLAAGGVSLVGGLYAALVLLAVPVPDTAAGVGAVHGPVMVFGFVGTVVALERAVALRARWALLSPACSALGALALLAGAPPLVGRLLLAVAGTVLLGMYAAVWRRQPGAALLTQWAGALCWYTVALLWLGGYPVSATVPWLAGFVVLTIAGERLELAHLAIAGRAGVVNAFLVLTAGLLAGATASLLWPGPGTRLAGLALLGLVGWLVHHDTARRTVRGRGLPRFVAVGLLAGYGWLALAGALWVGAGTAADPARYDAVVHAVFLGFTLSMIFAHAPVILPAVLRRPLPYHPVLYAPLALLHASLAARLALGDWAGLDTVWRWAGVANEVSIVAFLGCAVTLVLRARPTPPDRTRRARGEPVPADPGQADPGQTDPAQAEPGPHAAVGS